MGARVMSTNGGQNRCRVPSPHHPPPCSVIDEWSGSWMDPLVTRKQQNTEEVAYQVALAYFIHQTIFLFAPHIMAEIHIPTSS